MLGLSDGVKKGLILAPTAILPARWRVAARRPLLARLEVEKARRTGLLVIGHPKSGNTWLRVQLSRVYQMRHGLPGSVIVTSDELHRRHPAIPRISATNAWYSYERAVGDLLAPDAAPNEVREKPIVFLARNPIDIAVSWYFQVTRRQSRAKFELINHDLPHPIDRTTIQMWEFVRESDIGLLSLIDYLNHWEEAIRHLPRAIRVRYEDLRADPARELRRVGELMGGRFSDAEIAEAVAFGSYDNLKKLESEGFFRQKGLRPGVKGDPESHKVRRAKVGGYRDYFTPEQIAELEALVAGRLAPSLGYTPSRSAQAPIAAAG